MSRSTPTPAPAAQPPSPASTQKAVKKDTRANSVIFESANAESHQFDVCGVRGYRDNSGKKVLWRVPEDRVERFERHTFVVNGRIKRSETKPSDKKD